MAALGQAEPVREAPDRARTWIFQANPAKYRILDSLVAEREEYWNLNQHAKSVRPGDRVLIWVCGDEAGIYAQGTVMSSPIIIPDSNRGLTYWNLKAEGKRPKARVRVRYDHLFLDKPLLRQYLECDPGLSGLQILRSPRGTNFPVRDEEWEAIHAWLQDQL